MSGSRLQLSTRRLASGAMVVFALLAAAAMISPRAEADASVPSPSGQGAFIPASLPDRPIEIQSIDPSLATFNPCPTPLCGIAIVDGATGRVYGVIVGSNFGVGQQTTNEYMGCPPGCWQVVQAQQTADGNVAGWHGPDVIYDFASRVFTLPGGGTLVSGARMDEVIYPTTTTVPSASTTSSPTTSATTTIAISTTIASSTTQVGSGGSPSSSTTTTTSTTAPGTTTTGAPSSGAGSPQTTFNPCPTPLCGIAIVDGATGRVYGVIVGSNFGVGQQTTNEYMGCPPGCWQVVQAQQTADGNVAGWHGPDVIYDFASRVFTLPGGGTLVSGARMDEVIFPIPTTTTPPPGLDPAPSPTTSATTPVDQPVAPDDPGVPDDDEPSPDGSSSVQSYLSESGVLHQTLAEFIWFESLAMVSPIWIGVELPTIASNQVSYRTFFDPVGSRPLALVGQGSFVESNLSIMSGTPNRPGPLLVLVDRKALGGSRGMLIVEVSTGGRLVGYAASSIGTVRAYSSCAQLRADYPGGVSFGPGATNKLSEGELFGPTRRPVAHQSLYTRNARLDADGDLIACEP